MARGEDWTRDEVRETVNSYMQMLVLELSHQPYNKTEHRNALRARLSGRSDGAVELKHQNISAVLNELGYFWIPGYKPRSNYQQLLADEVVSWTKHNPTLDQVSQVAAEAAATVPIHCEFENFVVGQPAARQTRGSASETAIAPGVYLERVIRRDYWAREAQNRSLGLAGELLALRYEQERLSRAGEDRLAAKVEHVSRSRGDGLGFDILSFETDSRERFIEVKTTAFSKETPFFASAHELAFAKRNPTQFRLYRLFRFKAAPQCFVLTGALHEHCQLDPVSFRCSLT